MQAQVNIGLVGHVDHGKTTITKALTGKWTDTHSEEVKRGITIRLGYADADFNYCPKCKKYTAGEKCECGGKTELKRKVAFVDAPGHETLMATMISGSAIMDGALLVIAANESCPQPQTWEHLMALDICGVKKIVIVQNKLDLVSREQALKHKEEIEEFVKGTVAEDAMIIPIAAHQRINIDALIEAIEEAIPTPERDVNASPLMMVARSFDINRPGADMEKIVGGTVGGSIVRGKFVAGDEIEIRPGYMRNEKQTPARTRISSLTTCGKKIDEALPGGLIAFSTTLDPAITKGDQLVGNLVGRPGELPEVMKEIRMVAHLMKRMIGVGNVEPIKEREPLVLNIGTATTIGFVAKLNPLTVTLKRGVCAEKTSKVAISRRINNRWRLIGYGEIC